MGLLRALANTAPTPVVVSAATHDQILARLLTLNAKRHGGTAKELTNSIASSAAEGGI
jgi:hypothetical protein